MPSYIHIEDLKQGTLHFAVAICATDAENWYTGGHTREQAVQVARANFAQFPKPNYLVVAKYDAVKLKRDIALLYMPPQGRA